MKKTRGNRKSEKRADGEKQEAFKQPEVLVDLEKKENETIAQFEKHLYDLEQMLEISRSFCSTLELKSLIESILYIAMAQMRVTGAGLFVIPSIDSDDYYLSDYYSGLEIDQNIEYKISKTSPLTDFLSASKKVYTIEELRENLPDCKDIDMLESLNPSLIVPLHLKNRINGILFMGERIFIEGFSSEYNDYERNEISTIASLASVAVHNASLIEQSSTDMMTHLKLKYYFFNMLEDKLDAACSQGQNIAVAMFDIDFFKKFNDTYGHACGDYVLKSVAKIIKSNIREEDMASRYGGEEFTIMLCDTNEQEALLVAERIRKSIEETDFFYEDQHLHVTISGGIATFDSEKNPVLSAKALVDQADKALYVSKENGRNRITVSNPEEK